MATKTTSWVCSGCGHTEVRHMGRCPKCQAWGSFAEAGPAAVDRPAVNRRASANWGGASGGAVKLSQAQAAELDRLATGLPDFDLVLGGGLTVGSVNLIGGDPGIGKSTLLMQVLAHVHGTRKVVYVSGEESPRQLKMRADRLGYADVDFDVLPATELEQILDYLQNERPAVAVVDSIQTLYSREIAAGPGSVSQVKECASRLTSLAKAMDISLLVVGHVTKDGDLAGPQALEHIVDAVLVFEGAQGSPFRMIRAQKNRFGGTGDIGVFAMGAHGLEQVDNPSSMFLSAHKVPVPGSCVLSTLEGNRPFLVEVQGLVEESLAAPNAKRYASGVDTNRLQMLLAVLNKHASVPAFDSNVYIKVVGGVRLTEPGADLAVLLAAYSSLRDKPLPEGLVVFGEVGLVGEVRAVSDPVTRLREAAKLGFTRAIVPAASRKAIGAPPNGITVTYADRVDDVLVVLKELRLAA